MTDSISHAYITPHTPSLLIPYLFLIFSYTLAQSTDDTTDLWNDYTASDPDVLPSSGDCGLDWWHCQNGDCIPNFVICDSRIDCRDFSDEHGCIDIPRYNGGSNTPGTVDDDETEDITEDVAEDMTELPVSHQDTVVGQKVVIPCGVQAKNASSYNWTHRGQKVTKSIRVTMLSRYLRIAPVDFNDEGEYTCSAEAEIDQRITYYTRKTMLSVKQRTQILDRMCGYKAPAKTSVTLDCLATSDPSLPITMSWVSTNGSIDAGDGRFRIVQQASQLSLTISDLRVSDSGNYTCVAQTSADNATSQLQLTVLDVPKQPLVAGMNCNDEKLVATVNWTDTGDNESPILFHQIQFNTAFLPEQWTTAGQTDASTLSFQLPLSPWVNYTFRVISTNWIGSSLPSLPSHVCSTPSDAPFTNPRNVKAKGRFPNSFAISWTPMPEIEHNGPGFGYNVSWKVNDSIIAGSWNFTLVDVWRESEIVITDQPPNTTYLVSVKALNSHGPSTSEPIVITGFSGQNNIGGGGQLTWLQLLGIILCILVPMIIILMLSVSYILERERRKQLEVVIKEFIEGNAKAEQQAATPAEKACYKPFTSSLEEQDVQVDYSRVLGSGNFGNVFAGTYEGKSVAVKLVKPGSPVSAFDEFFKELKIMVYIGKHDHILHFIGAVTSKLAANTILAVLELSPIGSLESYLREHITYDRMSYMELQSPNRNTGAVQPLPLKTLLSFCRQIAAGMQHLVDKAVIHGDLATRNVLVFPDEVVKVSDFGFSRNTYGGGQYQKMKNCNIPFRWAAIETLEQMTFSHEADVWSYGVTVWEIFTLGNCPFTMYQYSDDFIRKIREGLRLTKPDRAPDAIYEGLMLQTRNLSPRARPSFKEIIEILDNFQECS